MACPYFFPTARLENGSWVIPPRVPLGDGYAGECRATAVQFQPDESHLRNFCNMGYGRGVCEQFPRDGSVDAIRFHVREESAELIRIQCVAEKDCWPAGGSDLEYSIAAREIQGANDPMVAKQAAVFVESYLRRKNQALEVGA
jgi:hypothetical protein